jgi:hypothetical protein
VKVQFHLTGLVSENQEGSKKGFCVESYEIAVSFFRQLKLGHESSVLLSLALN